MSLPRTYGPCLVVTKPQTAQRDGVGLFQTRLQAQGRCRISKEGGQTAGRRQVRIAHETCAALSPSSGGAHGGCARVSLLGGTRAAVTQGDRARFMGSLHKVRKEPSENGERLPEGARGRQGKCGSLLATGMRVKGYDESLLFWQLFCKLQLVHTKYLKKRNWSKERNGIYSKPDLEDSVTILTKVLCQPPRA